MASQLVEQGSNGARNRFKGPTFHRVDLALPRLVSLAARRTIELRLEVFNLFYTFNWGGDPRIMQFGIKYGF